MYHTILKVLVVHQHATQIWHVNLMITLATLSMHICTHHHTIICNSNIQQDYVIVTQVFFCVIYSTWYLKPTYNFLWTYAYLAGKTEPLWIHVVNGNE